MWNETKCRWASTRPAAKNVSERYNKQQQHRAHTHTHKPHKTTNIKQHGFFVGISELCPFHLLPHQSSGSVQLDVEFFASRAASTPCSAAPLSGAIAHPASGGPVGTWDYTSTFEWMWRTCAILCRNGHTGQLSFHFGWHSGTAQQRTIPHISS